MPRTSFPGRSSPLPPTNSKSNSNSNISDDTRDDDIMAAEYERRWAERHSEENHTAALAAALALHTAIRERALSVLEVEQLREENERKREETAKLREKRLQLEERNRVETERAMEAMRIQEEQKKAKEIPKLQPSAPTSSQTPIHQSAQPGAGSPSANQQFVPATTQTSTTPNGAQAAQEQPSSSTSQPAKRTIIKLNTNKSAEPQKQPGIAQDQAQAQAPAPRMPPQSFQMSQATPAQQTPSMQAQAPQPQANVSQGQFHAQTPQQQSPITQGQVQDQAPQTAQASSAPAAPRHNRVHPSVDRYIEIHKELKEVRKAIKTLGDENAEWKKVIGDMRRTINRTVGQLTQGGNNKPAFATIAEQIDKSLNPKFPTRAYDVRKVLVLPTMLPTEEGVPKTMPILTIYLFNILAKVALSQCISEAGANPKAAEPIGIILVSVFAQSKYCFGGRHSLFDIVLAKLRILCPVLFGIRGNEKTEEGRAKLGWKKDVNGNWISEQEHNDRMTGLGAGYASMCLRDFSRSALSNPMPSHNYWFSLATITLTPPGEVSSTQFIVLKAMIDNYTSPFLRIYGDMGIRALHVVLEEFPRKAPSGNVAANSLHVLAAKLRRDTGLVLAAH